MGPSSSSLFSKRFRANPVETALVAGFALLFCQSVYDLCLGYDGIVAVMERPPERSRLAIAPAAAPAAAPALAAAPGPGVDLATLGGAGTADADRAPSSSTAVPEISIDCEHEGMGATVAAASVRLSGALCHAPAHFDVADPAFHAEATHLATGAQVGVKVLTAADGTAPRFSTEPLALQPGPNSLHIELVYPDGTRFARNIQVISQAPAR